MAVPYTFGTATAAIPLSQLDSNFATAITIGNTAVQLGNTVTTLNNMTLANVTISSGTINITNVAVTTANVSGTANVSTLVVVGNETVGGNTTITGNITAANANVTTNLVLSGGTANGVAYLNTSKVLTTGSALVFDGTNLGLGIASPYTKGEIVGGKLQVSTAGGLGFAGGGGINLYTGAGARLYFYDDSNSATIGSLKVGGTNALTFSAGGATEQMRLDASGRLGIGATSPGSILDVQDGIGATRITVTNTANAAAGAGVNFIVKNGVTTVGNATIRADNTDNLAFFNLTGETARIDSSGNLLVGTTNASVASAAGFRVYPSGIIASTLVGSTSASDTFEIYSTGASAYRFYVTMDGKINCTSTTIAAISDQRLKENIQDLDVGLEKIMALKPRKFDWKENKGKNIKGDRGWIAQEFEQVFPDMISTWKDEPPEGESPYKAVAADLIPVLVKAIQEQNQLITTLTARITALEGT